MSKTTKTIRIGQRIIGGGNPIAVQSMTNSDTADREATASQLRALEKAGCDIARFTVNTPEAARNIPYYKTVTTMPLVADIHFDYQLALEAADAGIDKIRINPGNIGSAERIRAVCQKCREKNIPIRVGVNGGSLEKEVLAKYGAPTAEAIAESAMNAVRALEKFDFNQIVVSIKSSDVRTMIDANRELSKICNYPLHLGVTEAGIWYPGSIKSAIGIGALLADGIGDTIRVSLTDDVVKEVEAANEILYALRLKSGIRLVCCPTCGRTKIDLIPLAKKLSEELKGLRTEKEITVALMGCVVNGPGEAREADVGAAGGVGEAMIFKKGQITGKVPEEQIVPTLLAEVKKLL